MADLLPCPFCGGKAERIDIEDGDNAGGSCVICAACNASGNVEFGFKENFVSNWNRRAPVAGWIRTIDRLPEKPGKARYEYVDCLIVLNGEVISRPWNCEHLCWDDEEKDDFFCDADKPTHWMPLPAAPVDGGEDA